MFIIGMEEGVFPHSRAFADNEELEEERRLAYVGITRAEEELFLTCARMRTLFGRTPRTRRRASWRRFRRNSWRRCSMGGCHRRRLRGELAAASCVGGSGGCSAAGSRAGRGAAGASAWGTPSSFGRPSTARLRQALQPAAKPRCVPGPQPAAGGAVPDYTAGDKVSHGKWGIGTVVSVKGTGNDTELQIAFPAPVGMKRLLAGFAPITKVIGVAFAMSAGPPITIERKSP